MVSCETLFQTQNPGHVFFNININNFNIIILHDYLMKNFNEKNTDKLSYKTLVFKNIFK